MMKMQVARKPLKILFLTAGLWPAATWADTLSDQADPSADVVLAEQKAIIEDRGAANRILAGDLLRTLSQEIPAAVCHLHQNTSVEKSRELLSTGSEKFTTLITALMEGDEVNGIIGPEERRATRMRLEELQTTWTPLNTAANDLLDDPTNAEAAELIFAAADPLLDQTFILLSELEGQYSNPVEILQSDVLLLDIAGRIATMTQRMAYEACRIWSGAENGYVAELTSAIGIFENSLVALTDGAPQMGIQGAPTPEIREGLVAIGADWSVIRGQLETVLAGEATDREMREDLYDRLTAKLQKSEEVLELYQNYAKRVF